MLHQGDQRLDHVLGAIIIRSAHLRRMLHRIIRPLIEINSCIIHLQHQTNPQKHHNPKQLHTHKHTSYSQTQSPKTHQNIQTTIVFHQPVTKLFDGNLVQHIQLMKIHI